MQAEQARLCGILQQWQADGVRKHNASDTRAQTISDEGNRAHHERQSIRIGKVLRPACVVNLERIEQSRRAFAKDKATHGYRCCAYDRRRRA
jgi:hypothetical protein